MTPELRRRLGAGERPFDGTTLRSVGPQPAADVRRALARVVDLLEESCPGAILYRLSDRRDADGEPTTPRTTSWTEVRSWLVADQRLFIARSGERDVYTALYPHHFTFYLRFYLDDEILPGTPLEGRWDVTASHELAERVEALADELPGVARESAGLYFAV